MSRVLPCLMLFCALPLSALAQSAGPVAAPSFRVGDAWVFDDTVEKGQAGFGERRVDIRIERIDDTTMTVGMKRDGAPEVKNWVKAVGEQYNTDGARLIRTTSQLLAHKPAS